MRKARNLSFFMACLLICLIAVGVELMLPAEEPGRCDEMPKYNGYQLPELPESEYQNAYISVSGETAYLYFVDKLGYIEAVEGTGANIYTLGLTSADEYDESRILYAEAYTATIGGESWTREELTDFSDVWDIPPYAQFALACEQGPHWSNVTLLDQYGNVFIEGSTPGTDFCLRSWLTGYLTGLCGEPMFPSVGGETAPEATNNALQSSDGYSLMDSEGLYLIPKGSE